MRTLAMIVFIPSQSAMRVERNKDVNDVSCFFCSSRKESIAHLEIGMLKNSAKIHGEAFLSGVGSKSISNLPPFPCLFALSLVLSIVPLLVCFLVRSHALLFFFEFEHDVGWAH